MINRLDKIKDNTLIICPNDYKNKLLKEFNDNKLLLNVSFLSIEEYKKNYFFDYDYKAIKFLVDNHHLSVNNSKEILNNLYYVEDKDYKNKKLDDLVKYKKELSNLLIYNPLFKKYLSNKNIVVVGYGKLDSLTKSMFSNDTTYIEYEYLNKKYNIKKTNDIEKEVEYVYNSIFDLLESGIDINKIYLLNPADEYSAYIKRHNSYYPFKIKYIDVDTLYGLDATSEFLNKLNNKEELYEYLVNSNNEYSNSFINIINKYAECDDLNGIKELIIEDLKNTHLSNDYTNVVNCVNMFTSFNDDDYVFYLGFNDLIPSMKKDTFYITNNIRHLVNMQSVDEENRLIKENTINYLSNINNLYLSYCESSPFTNHDAQTLFNDVSYEEIINDNNHSNALNKYKYSRMLDDLNKYGTKDDDINDMYSTYLDNNYNTYDNNYKKFNVGILDVNLSYSSMNNYYKCAFKYYLENVLKVDKRNKTFFSYAGSVIHYVLEKIVKDNSLDFDALWQEGIEIEDIKFESYKDIFFMNKLKEEIREDVEIIKKQKDISLFDKIECEKVFNVTLNEHTKFNGRIDKILKHKNNICVIDYKTGNNKIEPELYEYGLSLQLPSYLYLIKNSDEYKNCRVVGYYIQHLINTDKNYNSEKTLSEIKADSLKLDGYTNSENESYKLIDSKLDNKEKSSVIKSLALTNDGGFDRRFSKVMDDDGIDSLIKIVEEKILEASKNILDSNFDINPKKYGKDDKACPYCTFKDICYKRINNYIECEKKVKEKKKEKE